MLISYLGQKNNKYFILNWSRNFILKVKTQRDQQYLTGGSIISSQSLSTKVSSQTWDRNVLIFGRNLQNKRSCIATVQLQNSIKTAAVQTVMHVFFQGKTAHAAVGWGEKLGPVSSRFY